MAVLSDYTSGRISLANGSTTVTGTGTLFDVAKFREGDTLQIQNLTAVIASVNSDTSLTLTMPWTGTTLTNAIYRARYLPDGARVTAQATTLIELLGNGVLSNLAELGVEDGKVPIGNAAGEYELVDTDEFGVADPNGTLAKFAALTLAARQIFQTDENGALKAIALAGNKALVTDANKDMQQIDIGTLGRSLLALATGTNAQYVQGDGTLQAKTGLPVSTATQTALNAKANTASPTLTGTSTVLALRVGQGTLVGKAQFCNNNGVYIGEIGVGTGTGDTGKMGFYNSINGGWWFNGAVQITGALSKGSGTFLIDHPLDPFNRNLRHGFVEAPRYELIYRGTARLADGRATVDIDAASDMTSGTFEALTTNAVVSSLQNQVGFARLRPGEITGASFEIISEDDQCSDLISWVVIAERNDPFVKSELEPNTDSNGRFIPEFDKED